MDATPSRKDEIEREIAKFSEMPQADFQFRLGRFLSDHIASLESRIATLEQSVKSLECESDRRDQYRMEQMEQEHT